jgi:hypothetical protein
VTPLHRTAPVLEGVEGEGGSDAALGLLESGVTAGFEEADGGGNTLVDCGRDGGVCGPGGISPGHGGVPIAYCIVKDFGSLSGTGIRNSVGGLGKGPGETTPPENGRDGPSLPLARRNGGLHPFGAGYADPPLVKFKLGLKPPTKPPSLLGTLCLRTLSLGEASGSRWPPANARASKLWIRSSRFWGASGRLDAMVMGKIQPLIICCDCTTMVVNTRNLLPLDRPSSTRTTILVNGVRH